MRILCLSDLPGSADTPDAGETKEGAGERTSDREGDSGQPRR